jgi:Na+-translocating ferredoxin:NAD+ oxidoreductase RnfG subunit
MVRLFPDAVDYKTITKQISAKNLQKIEDKAGKLLAGQREAFQYYELMAKEKSLGHILTSTQKGEYGAIEFVFGIDKENKIISIYIQRSRERDREFKKREFLDKFIGKSLKDIENIKFKSTIGTQAVISGIKKELTAFETLK